MPIDSISSAVSGLNAAEQRLAISANNVANALTPGFKARHANQTEVSSGGTTIDSVSTDPTPGYPLSPDLSSNIVSLPPSVPSAVSVQGSNTDLIRETVQQILAKHSFSANLNTIKVQKEVDRSLLDIIR